MLGKITGALIRKEADAYRAQGLHEEAIALFKKSLTATPKLPADVHNAIEQQIQQLEKEMAGTAVDGREQLSDEQIAVIRQGWDGAASVDDLAVSAHALCAIGCYSSALEEFSTLIQRGYSPHRLVGAMATCLAHLNPPRELVDAVDRLAAGLFKDPRHNFAFKLLLAEEMTKNHLIDSALELCRHLGRSTALSSAYRARLEALKKNIASSPRKTLPRAHKKELSGGTVPASPSFLQRMRAAVKAFTLRMRSPRNGV